MFLSNIIGGWVRSASVYGMENAGPLLSQVNDYSAAFIEKVGIQNYTKDSWDHWEGKRVEMVTSYLLMSIGIGVGLRALQSTFNSAREKKPCQAIGYTILAVAMLGLAVHEIYHDIGPLTQLSLTKKCLELKATALKDPNLENLGKFYYNHCKKIAGSI